MAVFSNISVVLCTYNGQQFLQQQLESILAQTLLPCELVVCDDCSTDMTMEQLGRFAAVAPFPVRVSQNEEQIGSTRNFDQGIAQARGELIALCDQDDLWKPQKLERLQQAMEDKALGGIFTDASLIGESGQVMPETLWLRAGFTKARRERFQRDPAGVLLRQNVATGATMIFRARLRTLYGTIPVSWVHDGWLAWMLVLYRDSIGRLEPLESPLTRYRIHSSQQTGTLAVNLGLPSEPLRKRLAKARRMGHEHHKKNADRLGLVLANWLEGGGAPDAPVARRLRKEIDFLEKRSTLPTGGLRRLGTVVRLMPVYLRHGGGWRSAGRDLWA